MKVDPKRLIVYLPDTRGVTVSRFGTGNLKVGLNVHTYSRLPGLPGHPAVGSPIGIGFHGTCPGATAECLAVCYAARPVAEQGAVHTMWTKNSLTDDVPAELPEGCSQLRLHISGDFTSERYIDGWTSVISRNPDVAVWAYTRSWRVPALLPALERLRALPNVQLFASMDISTNELPPTGWRRAWIEGDERINAGDPAWGSEHNSITFDGTPSYVCPEQTKRRPNCETCGYCQHGRRGDVTFLEH